MNETNKSGEKKASFIIDSSVILSGQIIDLLDSGEFYRMVGIEEDTEIEIYLSRIVIAELENRANQDKTTGVIGVEMLKKLKDQSENALKKSGKMIALKPYGDRPSLEQIRLNSGGELDAAIRGHASELGATLITSDRIQADVAEIEKIPTIFIEMERAKEIEGLKIQDFFDEYSMSVHLKSNCYPQAKKGNPGNWKLKRTGDSILSTKELLELESNIISEAEADPESFIEKDLKGVTVVQLKNYRIVICRPPFSDSNEITAVKPLVKLSLDDYNINNSILRRFEAAEGILVAGNPGAGKSTFISALAEFYLNKDKVIKTLESVRDLQVPPEISQYTDLDDDFEKTADILLLVRPDYTIFDEIRTSGDFKIFTDLRLAGVGMIGVVHASSALDAIQRFIRRVELGVIPSVLDTVIFIKNGDISEILKLQINVKVPRGFRDQGLARPVIDVKDYYNNRLLYEIYEFGSNVVVMPTDYRSKGASELSAGYTKKPGGKKKKRNRKSNYQKQNHGINYNSDYFEDYYSDNPIDTDDLHSEESTADIKFRIVYGKKSLVLKTGPNFSGQSVDIFADNEFLASTTLNKNGEVHLNKETRVFKRIDSSIQEDKEILGKIIR